MIATENIKQETKQYITQFKQKEKKNKVSKEDDSRYQEIEEYNEKIYENHQKNFRDVSVKNMMENRDIADRKCMKIC